MSDAVPLIQQHSADAVEVDAVKTPTATVELTERELDIIADGLLDHLSSHFAEDSHYYADAETALAKCEEMRVRLVVDRMR